MFSKRTTLFLSAVILFSYIACPQANAGPSLGINLNGPADWNTELPFVDVFRLSRPWISQKEGAGWGKGPALSLDKHGWVKKLAPGCWAETLLCTIDGGHYPSGEYTVLFEGSGKIRFNNAKMLSESPGKMRIRVDSSRGAFFLQLRATDPTDPIRNIRVIMPGFERTWQKEPFHPVFLKRWQGVSCLRFMDWMHTNNSTIQNWADRPTPESATFCKKGVPLEIMLDLSNRLQADPWFCMPHLADDDFVRRFAQMVKERLAPERKVYVEYSNEIWNGMFRQSRWAGQTGQKLGLAEKPWEAAWHYTALRSVAIFAIWEKVFGSKDRLVRVLPTQAANPYVSRQILTFRDACKHADALAIAPYISFNVPRQGKGITASDVAAWSLDRVLSHMESKALPAAIRWIQDQKKVADAHGLKLVAYEGGQHMVGVGGGENNDAMTRLFHGTNRHPRMAGIYERYYQAWESAGGDVFCYFSSVGRWSKWGSWGILEFYDEDPQAAPKFTATMEWARRCGQAVQGQK